MAQAVTRLLLLELVQVTAMCRQALLDLKALPTWLASLFGQCSIRYRFRRLGGVTWKISIE